jgi:LL-diaminopimelate aminotransferase
LVNPGDVVLMTTPGYPVFGTHARYYGGQVYNLPLAEANQYLPDLDSIPPVVLDTAKVMVLNYPNNPTGASATPEFFARIVAFAQQHRLAIVHDAAYAALVFEGQPLSFLATPGAKEVGVELHSASKSFNMTGWRCGFVAGNALLVKAYGDVKDNSDSGQFLAIQHAAAHGFDHPEITRQIASKYSRRMDGLVQVLAAAGFQARKPKGSFYLYVKAPKAAVANAGKRMAFQTAEDVSQWLITEKLISTVPWDDAGAYLRFSVTFAAKGPADETRIMQEIARRLGDVRFEF